MKPLVFPIKRPNSRRIDIARVMPVPIPALPEFRERIRDWMAA